MADFAEMFPAKQIDADTYSFCWEQVDLALEDNDVIDYDYSSESGCTVEELCDALEAYGFDTDKVLNHFKDYPCSRIVLTDEY